MSVRPKAPPHRQPDYVSSYGYRHNLPMLTKEEWQRGLIWRWNTNDVTMGGGHGIMACYLARIPFWQWVMRLLFETYYPGEWRDDFKMPEPDPEPEEFRYPPGFVPEAFWFRLDFSGPSNPRDPGFEWAWNKPLLSVEEVMRRDGYRHDPKAEKQIDRLTAIDETGHEPDAEWAEYMASEYVSYEEFKAVKAGKLPSLVERLRAFDDRYERPTCKCGVSHPQMHTPMNKAGTDWDYKGSYYECKPGCGRKWQTKSFKAAMELQPVPETLKFRHPEDRARLRDEYDNRTNFGGVTMLPKQLRNPPRVG